MSLTTEIKIALGEEQITLRPSLRRALRLASREGSFSKLIAQIEDGSLTAFLALIADNYSGEDLANKIMKYGLDSLKEPLLAYLLDCAGLNDDLEDKINEQKPKAKPTSFEDHLTGLFRIATGWLGWTPNQAWDATPAEIIEAYKGRVEMFKAIFGSSDDDEPKPPVNISSKFQTVFQSFGTTKVERPR